MRLLGVLIIFLSLLSRGEELVYEQKEFWGSDGFSKDEVIGKLKTENA